MTTQVILDRMRADLNQTENSLSTVAIDSALDRGIEVYPDTESLQYLSARLILLNQVIAAAVRLNDFQQNETMEHRNQIFQNLLALRKLYRQEFQEALDLAELDDQTSVDFATAVPVIEPLTDWPCDV